MKPLEPSDPAEVGGFTLVARLGAGGMGIVYLATRGVLNVALKVMRDKFLESSEEAARFSREISILKSFESPHIARFIDAGVTDARPWFAIEFVNGPNLAEFVAETGPLGESEWWSLAEGIMEGLEQTHVRDVIHRDIKPSNVIVSETGPKLIDFGVAHVSDATSVTSTGVVAGSPAWFSPEQIENHPLTTATDVFSAGSLLTFAATGKSPWGDPNSLTKAAVFGILSREPDLSQLSEPQRIFVAKLLNKDPQKRPSAQDAISLIREKTGSSIPRSTTETGSAETPGRGRRRTIALAATVFLILAGAGIGIAAGGVVDGRESGGPGADAVVLENRLAEAQSQPADSANSECTNSDQSAILAELSSTPELWEGYERIVGLYDLEDESVSRELTEWASITNKVATRLSTSLYSFRQGNSYSYEASKQVIREISAAHVDLQDHWSRLAEYAAFVSGLEMAFDEVSWNNHWVNIGRAEDRLEDRIRNYRDRVVSLRSDGICR